MRAQYTGLVTLVCRQRGDGWETNNRYRLGDSGVPVSRYPFLGFVFDVFATHYNVSAQAKVDLMESVLKLDGYHYH